ncbi:MAG: DUF2218 domain-containing protein [Chloroflexota bacterium]
MTEGLSKQVVEGAIAHMNEDHQQNLLDYAQQLADCGWGETAVMTALDSEGFEIHVSGNGNEAIKRIPFAQPVADAKQLRKALVQMAMDARAKANPDSEPDGVSRTATAVVETAKAGRYLKALCNHFDRKANASYGDTTGAVEFDFGTCNFEATDTNLLINVSAESNIMLERTKQVVADHLVRFGKRESLTVEWDN